MSLAILILGWNCAGRLKIIQSGKSISIIVAIIFQYNLNVELISYEMMN